MLVVIDLADEDDEQTIFDTTNTAGVRLTCADIIKNALFQKVIRLIGPFKAIELYKSTWHKVFLAEADTIAFWEADRLTGRLTRDNIEVLLHSIAVIKGFYDPDKHILSELSKLYKGRLITSSQSRNWRRSLKRSEPMAISTEKRYLRLTRPLRTLLRTPHSGCSIFSMCSR